MRVAVIDTETTGLDADIDQVCEHAVIVMNRGEEDVWEVEAVYTQMNDITVPMTCEARAVHHIDPASLVGHPLFEQGWLCSPNNHLATIEAWVAHNAAFDRAFVGRHLPETLGALPWACTYRLAQHLWPEAPSFGNQVLRYWQGALPATDVTGLYPHQALYDVSVTATLFQRLARGRSLEQLVHLSQQPVLQTVVRFGKHYGQRWSDVPPSYCRWILGQSDFDPDVVYTAKVLLGLLPRPVL